MNNSYFWRMSPLRRLIWLKFGAGGGGSSSILKTVTGALLHITDALAKPAKKFVATLEPIQSGSGDPSPDNVRPITGHTGANVVVAGKNLWDKQDTSSFYISQSGEVVSNGSWAITDFIPVRGGSYIAYSGITNAGNAPYSAFYDSNQNFISSFKQAAGENSILAPEKARYVRFSIQNSNAIRDVFIVTIGNSVGEYSPYTATTIPITFPDAAGTVYGGTLTLEDGVWKLNVDTGTTTFDGSNDEGWSLWTGKFVAYAPDTIKRYEQTTSTPVVIADRFKSAGVKYRDACDDGEIIKVVGDNRYVACYSSAYASVEDFTTSLSTNSMTIVYPLATPIDYTLTESQALTLLKGENNIWVNDSDDLELQYYAKAE